MVATYGCTAREVHNGLPLQGEIVCVCDAYASSHLWTCCKEWCKNAPTESHKGSTLFVLPACHVGVEFKDRHLCTCL